MVIFEKVQSNTKIDASIQHDWQQQISDVFKSICNIFLKL